MKRQVLSKQYKRLPTALPEAGAQRSGARKSLSGWVRGELPDAALRRKDSRDPSARPQSHRSFGFAQDDKSGDVCSAGLKACSTLCAEGPRAARGPHHAPVLRVMGWSASGARIKNCAAPNQPETRAPRVSGRPVFARPVCVGLFAETGAVDQSSWMV